MERDQIVLSTQYLKDKRARKMQQNNNNQNQRNQTKLSTDAGRRVTGVDRLPIGRRPSAIVVFYFIFYFIFFSFFFGCFFSGLFVCSRGHFFLLYDPGAVVAVVVVVAPIHLPSFIETR